MRVDLDELERSASDAAPGYPEYEGVLVVALIARIGELEAALSRVLVSATAMSVGATWRSELDAERAILEKGVVLP